MENPFRFRQFPLLSPSDPHARQLQLMAFRIPNFSLVALAVSEIQPLKLSFSETCNLKYGVRFDLSDRVGFSRQPSPRTTFSQNCSFPSLMVQKLLRVKGFIGLAGEVRIGNFYRAMLCIRGTSHGPVSVSLCPSVTSRSSTKTAKHRITQRTPHDSPGTLVF